MSPTHPHRPDHGPVRRPQPHERADPRRVAPGNLCPRRLRRLRERAGRRLVRAGICLVLPDLRRGRRRERPRCAPARAARRRNSPGRRGDRARADVRRDARGGDAGRRNAGARGDRSGRLQPRSGGGRGGGHVEHGLPAAGSPLRADGRHAGALRSLAERTGLAIVEDACQAHGAERDGIRAGAAGLAAAFSFYPAKNLGAMGDAGALTTDDAELAATVRALREHGQSRKYQHDLEGYTARLDTIQAIVLELKLRLLDGWNEERRSAARFLTDALAGVGDLALPEVAARQQSRLAPLRRSHCRSRCARRVPSCARHRNRPALPRAGASRPCICASRLRGGVVSRCRAGCERGFVATHVSGHQRSPTHGSCRRDRGVLQSWRMSRPTRRPTDC